jgi:regulator-associated protein of mTOR
MASSMGVVVDPFSVAEPSELPDWRLPLSFMKSRHVEKIQARGEVDEWRIRDRMKTWSVALCLCLNVGVDPPDVVKTNPCARRECWIDPLSMSPQKAIEQIGTTLQKQYERWQPRARYKVLLDPTTEDTRKLCISLRKTAKNERVLFHYNAHGVPKPTQNGEIWVFNKSYTQYIPMSMYDLQAWMGSPSIYVYDCSHAGLILDSFKVFARQRDSESFMDSPHQTSSIHLGFLNSWCIQLAACGPKEMLPMNPELPADLFTCCLTTPIKTALFW